MKPVRAHRPRSLHLGLFVAAYVSGSGFAHLLAVVPGTGISIWPPSGLFIATLLLACTPSWPWWMGAGFLAELFGNVLWFHNPLPVAVLIYAGNALEAAIGAWLVSRACGRPVRLETLREVLALAFLGAGTAPIVSATVGSATIAWFGMQSFATAWPLWWIGDATGVLIVAPPALVVFRNWRSEPRLSTARWMEAGVLGLIFLGVAALSLSGYYLPFAFIIMPPLLWAAVRFEFRGVAITLALLALITAVLTVAGASQFVGDPESQKQKQVMLQLFMAISALSALVVAALSRQHHLALLTLREGERSLRNLVETLPAQIWSTDPHGKPIYVSQQFRDFIGFKVEDKDVDGASRLSSVLTAIIHPDDLGMVSARFAHSLATGEPFALKHRQRRFDGEYRWVETRAAAMRNADGAIVQWNGVCLDIDDHVHAYAELERSEQRYRDVFNYMPIGLIQVDASRLVALFKELRVQGVTDLEAHIDEHPDFVSRASDALIVEAVNQHAVHMLGARSAAEIMGPVTRYWRASPDTLRRNLEARFRGEEFFQEETKLATLDGRVIDVLFTTARGGALADKALVGFIEITDRVRAQEALSRVQADLAHAARVSMLGELTASIAHEVNQPLAAITASGQAGLRWLGRPALDLAEVRELTERIVADARRAADVIARVRGMAARKAPEQTVCSLDDVIRDALLFLQHEARSRGVSIAHHPDPAATWVSGDRTQLQQVIVNLAVNSMQAMAGAQSGARRIVIRTGRLKTGAVRCSVEDSGPGVDPGIMARLFESFFTTKEGGMGMGLPICRSIIEAHGGRIAADNDGAEGGARFSFTLPAAASYAASAEFRQPISASA